MRKTLFFILGFAALTAFIPVSGWTQEQGKFLSAAGFDTLVKVINPGTIICVAGQLTGDPYSPCTPGTTRVHIKDQIVEMGYLEVTPASAGPLFGGLNRLTVDCNLDASLNLIDLAMTKSLNGDALVCP